MPLIISVATAPPICVTGDSFTVQLVTPVAGIAMGGVGGGVPGSVTGVINVASTVPIGTHMLTIHVTVNRPFVGVIGTDSFPYALTVTGGSGPSFPVQIRTSPDPADGPAPRTITFQGEIAQWTQPFCDPNPDPNGSFDWEWDFGDGTGSTGRVVTKTYQNPGSYRVTVKAKHRFNCAQGSASMMLTVTPGPSGTPRPALLNLQVDRGCGFGGGNYSMNDPITVSYEVRENATLTLYDFDPAGRLQTLTLGFVPANTRRSFTARIAANRGVETLVLQAMTISGGQVLTTACSFGIGGEAPGTAHLETQRGCDARFTPGEFLTLSYAVGAVIAIPVQRVRIFNVTPQGLSELTQVPLTSSVGTFQSSNPIGTSPGDRMLVLVAVTQTSGILTASCGYTVP
jgi:hypothetical protein